MKKIDWEEISKIALLGTDRRPISAKLLKQAQSLGIDTDDEPSKILTQLILAGNLLMKSARKFPKASEAEAPLIGRRDLHACPPYIARLFPRIIKENWTPILQEYTAVLAERGWRFPSQYLPALLNKAAMEPSFWYLIKPIVGQQAQTLIAMNPNWRDLNVSRPSNTDPFSPNVYGVERQIAINSANQRLMDEWPSLRKVAKLKYLQKIASNVSIKDEQLLLDLWNDKDKAVAQKIFDLLLKIPKSKTEKIRTAFFPKLIGAKKSMELPDLTSDEKQELKLLARHSEFKGGLKANLLAQLLSGTSWIAWEKHLKIKPEKLAGWLKKQDWSDQILTALFHICAREQNEELRFALFKYLTSLKAEIPENSSLLFEGMKTSEFHRLSHWSFEQGVRIFDTEGIYFSMALAFEEAWPNDITFGFFKMVKNWLHKNPRYWEGWYIWQIIRQLAFWADARQTPLLERAFQKDHVWLLAEDEIGKFLTILKFRAQFYPD